MAGKGNGLGVTNAMMVGSLLMWITLLLILVVVAPTQVAALSLNVETGTATQYSKLLTDIRNALKDPKLNYGGTGLPVIGAPTTPPKYLYVDLVSGSKTITIGLNKNDLYLVGYLETGGKTDRAQVFKDAPTNAETLVFPGKVKATRLSYTGSYAGIKGGTGADKTVPLGLLPLKNQFNKVHGVSPVVAKEQGRFLLTVIHMFSEATRFKYIESKIVENFNNEFDFYAVDPKAASLELEWGKISTGIKNSDKNGKIDPPLTDLKNVDGTARTVSKVSEIVGDMALLKFVKDRGLSLDSSDDEISSLSSRGNDDNGGTDNDLMTLLASFYHLI